MSRKKIVPLDKPFASLIIYALYKAIYQKIGDEAWDIVWHSGKILYDELKDKMGISNEDPPRVILDKIGNFFKNMGFIESMTIEEICDDIIEVTIRKPITWNMNVKLRTSGMVPSLILTPVLHAALEEAGYKLTRIKEKEYGDRLLIERWRIVEKR